MGIQITEEIKHRRKLERIRLIQNEINRREGADDEAYATQLGSMTKEQLMDEWKRVETELCE